MTRRRYSGLRLTVETKPKPDKRAQQELCFQLSGLGLTGFEVEYLFAKVEIGRLWRWDIAYVNRKIAVEVDGGIWIKGAHAHPTDIVRNMLKRNWGARLGWRILAFSPDQVQSGEALSFVEAVLKDLPYARPFPVYSK